MSEKKPVPETIETTRAARAARATADGADATDATDATDDGVAEVAAYPEKIYAMPGNRVLDPRSLRALAHPLRIQLLRALRHHGPATASQLAERLGESSGATSYHLRQLAAHGFVEDDPERGKGRERWWKAAQQGTVFEPSLHKNPDPEVQGAVEVFLHEIATIHTQELNTYLGNRHQWPDVWVDSSDMSDFTLHLDPRRAHELNIRIHELINEYKETSDPAAPDTQRVRMHLHSFPQHGSN